MPKNSISRKKKAEGAISVTSTHTHRSSTEGLSACLLTDFKTTDDSQIALNTSEAPVIAWNMNSSEELEASASLYKTQTFSSPLVHPMTGLDFFSVKKGQSFIREPPPDPLYYSKHMENANFSQLIGSYMGSIRQESDRIFSPTSGVEFSFNSPLKDSQEDIPSDLNFSHGYQITVKQNNVGRKKLKNLPPSYQTQLSRKKSIERTPSAKFTRSFSYQCPLQGKLLTISGEKFKRSLTEYMNRVSLVPWIAINNSKKSDFYHSSASHNKVNILYHRDMSLYPTRLNDLRASKFRIYPKSMEGGPGSLPLLFNKYPLNRRTRRQKRDSGSTFPPGRGSIQNKKYPPIPTIDFFY